MPEPSTKDFRFLNELSAILERNEAPSFLLEAAYRHVFLDEFGRNKTQTLSDPAAWDPKQLARILDLVVHIVARYTQLFQEPREIPVTHYKRQKALAIHLDDQFARVLRECVKRQKVLGLVDETGSVIRDPVLDAPILYLKQEARGKTFPKNKKGAVVSLKKLHERFEHKLIDKGIRFGEPDSDPSGGQDRFTYGP